MQPPLIEMCSGSIMHRLDVQWTVNQWKHREVTRNVVQSNTFTLHCGDSYLQFEPHQMILKVLLHANSELETATANAFCFDNIGQRHELESCGIVFGNKNVYSYHIHSFKVNKKAWTENIVFYIELSYITHSNETNVSLRHYSIAGKLQKTLLDDYDRMNKNEKSLQQDNVTFIIGNDKIQAHSIILASASPYFAAILQHENFKESKERTTNLTDDNDVTLENFQIFLDLLYGCKNIGNISIEFVTQICILADKYNVKELFESCELILSRTLSNKNVTELLLFAEKYNCEYLKKKALDYAKRNIDDVKKLPNFDALYENKALLIQLL